MLIVCTYLVIVFFSRLIISGRGNRHRYWLFLLGSLREDQTVLRKVEIVKILAQALLVVRITVPKVILIPHVLGRRLIIRNQIAVEQCEYQQGHDGEARKNR